MKTPPVCCVITRLPEAESLKKSEGAAFYELRLDLRFFSGFRPPATG
ncbi:MAG: hypothetical protein EGMGGAKC_00003 [Dehalococcoides mccartyi]|nr:hypothetical protein [Dehalococcoides mccartyi]